MTIFFQRLRAARHFLTKRKRSRVRCRWEEERKELRAQLLEMGVTPEGEEALPDPFQPFPTKKQSAAGENVFRDHVAGMERGSLQRATFMIIHVSLNHVCSFLLPPRIER